jgi:hypothetical protein
MVSRQWISLLVKKVEKEKKKEAGRLGVADEGVW